MDEIRARFEEVIAARGRSLGAWTLRIVDQHDEAVSIRRDVVEPPSSSHDIGVMISVEGKNGTGYCATSDITRESLGLAVDSATRWADTRGGCGPLPQPTTGRYQTETQTPWHSVPLGQKIDRLRELSSSMVGGGEVVDWSASLWHTAVDTVLVGSGGGTVQQSFSFIVPMMSVTAAGNGDSQTRTLGGHAYARQGGLEVIDSVGFWSRGRLVRDEAVGLLHADNCPQGNMSIVLAPDQMILQIHESIGHPLELDRILGDERNYAGTSFVRPEMFGNYQYGSDLLNVTFDPTVPGEFASYGFDDEGQVAEKTHLIRDGVLVRGLGGTLSQQRVGLPGVANSRASSWNRPAIDRMANLNLESGESSLEELVSGVEDGLYMETNRSWSIDDSRNKFQFGCELGRRIRGGQLAEVVKNPNYRGVSATFWRNLDGVGNGATVEVLGTPFCGKGEPNQVIRVGHASPACRFAEVDVFGGE